MLPYLSVTYMAALAVDDSLPMSSVAKQLWLNDLKRNVRWALLPVLKLYFSMNLLLIWYFKRLPLPQFRAHRSLQKLICWFCKHFVSYEANVLILRHFATESNILNFVKANSKPACGFNPVELYPLCIDDMLRDSFVKHDQELFKSITEFGSSSEQILLNWNEWRDVDSMKFSVAKRWTQILDLETGHILFMSLFCLLLTAEEYEGAINGFSFDHSLAVRLEKITGHTGFINLAYSRHPMFLVDTKNLNQRFLMHGMFTEQVNAKLQKIKDEGPNSGRSILNPHIDSRCSASIRIGGSNE
jgi:hypothetical protein